VNTSRRKFYSDKGSKLRNKRIAKSSKTREDTAKIQLVLGYILADKVKLFGIPNILYCHAV